MSNPRVLIVGGGFAGLYVARGLAGAPVRVTLVDKHNYHLFRPMLYQAATGLLSADEIAAPLRSVLRDQRNVEVLMAEVVGVDAAASRVMIEGGNIAYDQLVLATGIQYNYFGNPAWPALAPGLDSVDEADRIRGKIFAAFESAERLAASGQADARLLRELLTFVQVGAGTAGVEMAATIAELVRMTLAKEFRHIQPGSAHILLLEAGPRILATYPEALSQRALDHLRRLGVDVRTSAKVEQVDARGVVVNGERIASQTVLWSAGVVASPAGQWLAADVDRSGRVKVNPDLSVPNQPNIFAVGDTAALSAYSRNLFGLR
ncbi:MAG TPA: NAD(P)/FAD-dependent oxidoreductase, partial [Polyangiaceae bacterium]